MIYVGAGQRAHQGCRRAWRQHPATDSRSAGGTGRGSDPFDVERIHDGWNTGMPHSLRKIECTFRNAKVAETNDLGRDWVTFFFFFLKALPGVDGI